MDYKFLVNEAKCALKNSYSPYSNVKVGAALLSADGKIYKGCNIENAAYAPTNCAERTAIFNAVSNGERNFKAIAVVGEIDGKIQESFPPCGVCRQVMAEFCDKEKFEIILGSVDSYKIYKLKDLLPLSFEL